MPLHMVPYRAESPGRCQEVLLFELLLCQSSSMKATMPVRRLQALEAACMQEQQQS